MDNLNKTPGMEDGIDRFLSKSPRPALCGAILRDGETIRFARGDVDPALEPVFEIGSIGKTFTASLLALLVRDGLVSLDDPVSKYRPQYPFAASVTLRHLASHTAGLPANPAGALTMLTRARGFMESFRPDDLDTFLRTQRTRPKAIGHFAYSNIGMALLGHLLAEHLGTGYERAVTERVLKPLGMDDTRIDPRSYPEGRLVAGHTPGGRQLPPFVWPGMEPAGTWFSTVSDMLRFLRAQVGMAGPDWAALGRTMTTPVARAKSDLQIGLGWMLSPLPRRGEVAWHTGGTLGQHAVVAWTLAGRHAAVLLTNRRPPLWHHFFGSRRLEDLADLLMADAERS